MAEEQVARSISNNEERSTGRVVKFSEKKGFGFIKPDDGGDDLFVHHSAIKSYGGYRSLSEDDAVEFTVSLSDNKYQAINVTAPGGGPIQPSRRGDGYARRAGGGFGGSWGRRNNGGGGAVCYSCGNSGHLARDCNFQGGADSYRGGGDSNGGGCFKCGSSGHFARDCPRPNGGVGGTGSGGACFNCGGYGHLARDCPGGGGACYNCGGYGHLARDCTSARSTNRFVGGGTSGLGGGGTCFNCGEGGHFARDCPNRS